MDLSRRTTLGLVTLGGIAALAGCSKVDATTAKSPGAATTAPGSGATTTSTTAAAPSPSESSAAPSTSETPTQAAGTPKATLTSKHALTELTPDDTLTVKVSDGEVSAVDVVTSDGTTIPGRLEGQTWQPMDMMGFENALVATVTMKAADGSEHTQKFDLRTQGGSKAGFLIMYSDHAVGVGMPVMIQFVKSVQTRAMRAAIEKRMSVETSPKQEGSWGWLDDQHLYWRPKDFWQAGTTVTVKADIGGARMGDDLWVNGSETKKMSFGDARVLYVDIKKHQMRITRNGKTVKTLPVTCGKEGFTTRSGTKVISEKYDELEMDSGTVDIPSDSPDAYKIKVNWAQRLTWTGEFIHAAPWSVDDQGKSNVSHGCTGVSEENGDWLYNFTREGDPVVFTGTDRILEPDEAIGVWCFDWKGWQKQSALV